MSLKNKLKKWTNWDRTHHILAKQIGIISRESIKDSRWMYRDFNKTGTSLTYLIKEMIKSNMLICICKCNICCDKSFAYIEPGFGSLHHDFYFKWNDEFYIETWEDVKERRLNAIKQLGNIED